MNWKTFVLMIVPMLRSAGEAKKAEDSNSTGKDDLIGASLIYAADLLEAVVLNKLIPKAPKELQ